ncbi:hypothetical protein MNBD_ACTINO02-370 [hydrothermal vent metagenome]|uniref:Blue (type 1) copper domain-containing protein n=1 Tax=hydrothermal vent metagenome TaxID=652676 RepID=A0A3B0TLI5_9ZZZZ
MNRQNTLKRTALALAAIVVFAACSGSTPGDTTAPTTQSSEPTITEPLATMAGVQIVNFAFNEPAITVKVGDTVTWTNEENGIQHTTTADEGLWSSGSLDSGDMFEFTFSEPGTYTYLCTIHPSMTGTITVTE